MKAAAASSGGSYHVAVIGAGHNGLVAATRLALAGKRVVVLEAREAPGGLASVEEFHPGFRAPGPLHTTHALRAEVVRGLDLASVGLKLRAPPPVHVPLGEGRSVALHADPRETAEGLRAVSADEARGYEAFAALSQRVRKLIYEVLSTEPPPMSVRSAGDAWDLGKRGLALRRLGRADMLELMRVTPMCAADWLGETLTLGPLKAALALPGVLGTFQGPWSAGSAATLLFEQCTAGQEVVGGSGALVDALVARARAAGVEIRTGAEVSEIRVEGGRVTGVALKDGGVVAAEAVAASCDPRRALMELVDPLHLPIEVEDQIRVFRCRGSVAKVDLAVSGPVELPGRKGEAIEALALAGETVDDLERAYDAVKYRSLPERPALDVRIPSVSRPDLAPAGHHVVSVVAGFVPYHLDGGWSDAAREAVGDAVVRVLGEHLPDLPGRVLGRRVLTPADIAERYRVTGGHVHHGEHALDQLLFMRPGPSLSRYKAPIPGLYLCGSGSHPGGGITGAPGWLGAAAILGQSRA